MFCLGVLVVLCLPFAEAAGPDTPEALIDAWVRAWNAHDMKALGALYADDATLVNRQGMFFKDRAEIVRDHQESHAAHFRNATFTATINSVRFPTPDVAVICHTSLITGALDSAGNPRPPGRGTLVLIVAAKMADGWKIIAKQVTDAPTAKSQGSP
jgi:uncharacterized protein (TIGR02246 family)